MLNRPSGQIVGNIYWPLVVRAPPTLPGSHHGVLHHWQLIEFIADVIAHEIEQAASDGITGKTNRTTDSFFALLCAQPRHQVLTKIHRLRQTVERVAVTEKV